MEIVETRVLKSSFSGMKGAKKVRKMLEKSSTSYLGPGCREFESRHSDQNPLTASAVRGFCIDWLKLDNKIQLSGGQLIAAGIDGSDTLILLPCQEAKCKRVSPLG